MLMLSFTPVLVMAVNYSHDIATAQLALTGAALCIISRTYPAVAGAETDLFFISLYQSLTRLGKYSLAWIVAAGLPRIIFYTRYEWSDAAGDLQVFAIVIKHLAIFLLTGAGLYYWKKLGKTINKPRQALTPS